MDRSPEQGNSQQQALRIRRPKCWPALKAGRRVALVASLAPPPWGEKEAQGTSPEGGTHSISLPHGKGAHGQVTPPYRGMERSQLEGGGVSRLPKSTVGGQSLRQMYMTTSPKRFCQYRVSLEIFSPLLPRDLRAYLHPPTSLPWLSPGHLLGDMPGPQL